jgi:hypothetical protein
MATYTGLDLAPPLSATRPRPRKTLTAADILSMIELREADLARRNRRLLLIGLAILCGVPAIMLTMFGTWIVRYQSRPVAEVSTVMGGVAGVTASFSLLLAPFIRRGSRADAIQSFLDGRHASCNDNPLVRLLVGLMLAGALFGAFICVDALKTTLLKLRLRGAGVDRIRCATVLKELLEHDAGVAPHLLMRYGEDAYEFRRTLAWLMIHHWADLSPRGDHVMLLSPSRRALREPWTLD